MIRKPFYATLSSLLLASTLSISSVVAADSNSSFSDIENSFAKDAIIELQNAGILTGVDATHFNPTGELSRAEFVAIIVRSMKIEVDKTVTKSTFSDVSGWSIPYIEAAVKTGIINGTGNGKFDPSGILTREQSAVIIVKAIKSKYPDIDTTHEELTFSDADSISNWAKDYVAIAVKLGILKGNPNGTFNPNGNATREQAAVMGYNFIQKVRDIESQSTQEEPEPTQTPPVTNPPSGGGGTPQVDTQAPTLPQNVITSDITTTSITVIWNASTDNNGVTGYSVEVNDKVFKTTNTTSIIVDGLNPDTDYKFTVRAYDAVGNYSNYTESVTAHTLAVTPAVITNVHIESDNEDPTKVFVGDTVTLTFVTNEEVSKLDSFNINGSSPDSFSSVKQGDAWLNTTTFLFVGYETEGLVKFQIRVKNDAGLYSITNSTTDGSSVSVVLDYEHLEAELANSWAIKKDVSVSEDGTDIPIGQQWVTQTEQETLDRVIMTSNIFGPDMTQQMIDNRVTALKNAIEAYVNAKKVGTKVPTEVL